MGNYFEDRNHTRELRELDSQIQQLKQQLESCQSQLKEAIEVIEFYAESTTNLKARQFLAKYRGE